MANRETPPRVQQPAAQNDSAPRCAEYEPPRITAKLPLDKVTLFSGGGTGGGGGWIGNP